MEPNSLVQGYYHTSLYSDKINIRTKCDSYLQNYTEREINQPPHTAGEIKKSLIYIGNLSITKYYTKS